MTEPRKRVIIIGNGVAGVAAAKAIRDRKTDVAIVMYGDEPSLAYQRPMLTKSLLTGKPVESMLTKPAKWYEEHNIETHTNSRVKSIDRANKTVTLEDGSQDHYDKLIIAAGANSFIPPIPGSDQRNVFAIRRYRDMKAIEDAAADAQNVVVIGGGVLGLEAAWQFHKKGIHVTILELAPKLMVRQLDDLSSDLLYQKIKSLGMDVHVGVQIEAITGNGTAQGVRLSTGMAIPADLVIMSTGIRADVTLAKDAGLEINRAIVVDEHCLTSDKDIFAAGDCAEYQGINYGILPEAQRMGEVAGANAAGDPLAYETVLAAIMFQGMETHLYALGDVGKDASKQYRVKIIRDDEKGIYQAYYFADDVFTGAVLFGDTKDMKRVSEAYQRKLRFQQMFPEA